MNFFLIYVAPPALLYRILAQSPFNELAGSKAQQLLSGPFR
jgi:hypothetical protein